MGFPFEDATWDAVTGAMYIGANGAMPSVFTWVSVALCVWALWAGNRKEHKLYDEYEKTK